MEEKNKREEIQSRREFFKKAAKAALPVLGVTIFSALPIEKIEAIAPSGCTFGCSGGCEAVCKDSCMSSCTGNCMKSCSGNCWEYCANDCANSCSYGCSGSCSCGVQVVVAHVRMAVMAVRVLVVIPVIMSVLDTFGNIR